MSLVCSGPQKATAANLDLLVQLRSLLIRVLTSLTGCSPSNEHDSDMSVVQGAVTVAVRYGAMRRQFGPAGGPEISVLDYRSQQEKLMPLLASAYGIHFATRFLVTQYAEAKRTKEEDVIADVHALSAGVACLQHVLSDQSLLMSIRRCASCKPLLCPFFLSSLAEFDMGTICSLGQLDGLHLIITVVAHEASQDLPCLQMMTSRPDFTRE